MMGPINAPAAPFPSAHGVWSLSEFSYVQTVQLDFPSLAGMPESLSRLPVNIRVDELYARLGIAARTFPEYVSRPRNQAVLTQDANFRRCSITLGKFAELLRRGPGINRTELDELASRLGLDLSASQSLADADSQFKQLFQEVSTTAFMAGYFNVGPKERKETLESPFYQNRVQLSDSFQGVMGRPNEMEKRAFRQTLQDAYQKLKGLSNTITMMFCPH